MLQGSQWARVAAAGWDYREATVVCRELGATPLGPGPNLALFSPNFTCKYILIAFPTGARFELVEAPVC